MNHEGRGRGRTARGLVPRLLGRRRPSLLVLLGPCPASLPGPVLLLPHCGDPRAEPGAGRPARSVSVWCAIRCLSCPAPGIHYRAGAALGLAYPAGRHAGGLRLCPAQLPGQVPPPGTDHDPLRPADDGRGRGLHGAGWAAGPPEHRADGRPWAGLSAHRPAAHPGAGADRPRLLQRWDHRAHGGRVLVQPGRTAGRGGAAAGGGAAQGLLRDHPAASSAFYPGGFSPGFPLLLHQFRRDHGSRRAADGDARSGDLLPGGVAL